MSPPQASLPDRRGAWTWTRVASLVISFLGAGAGPSAGQGLIRLVPGAGEFGADSRLFWTEYASGSGSNTSELAAWIAAPLGGSFLDPRFLSWRFTLRPEFRRTTFSAAPEPLRGQALGWSGAVQVMAGHPISLSLQGGRHRATGEGGFGTRTENETSTLNGILASTNSAFPLQLTWNRQAIVSDFMSLTTGADIATSHDTRSLRLSGSSSKASLLIERTWNDDRIGPADYRAWSGLVTHVFRWGKGSRLESSYDLNDQTGQFPSRRRQWTERLLLQHTTALASSASWRQGTTEVSTRRTELRSVSYDLSARIGRAVSAGLSTGWYTTSSRDATEAATQLAPRAGITLRSSKGPYLNASASVGLDRRNRTGAAELTVPVINESHQIGPSRRFLLELPDPDPLSIVVRSADLAVVYEEGVDFELTVTGASARIDVLPGGRIEVGASVLVNYLARLPGDFADRAWLTDVQISAGAGAFRFRFASNSRDADSPRPVTEARGRADFANTTASLDYQADTPLGALSVAATFSRRDRLNALTEERGLGATLASTLSRSWFASAGLFVSRTETNTLAARSLSGQGSVAWQATRSLRLNLLVEGLVWDQAPEVPIRQVGGSLNAEWRFGQLETTLRLERETRMNGGRFGSSRVALRTRRRF